MVSDTKPNNEKTCSRCDIIKPFDKFIKKRNICKECSNKRKKELYYAEENNEQLIVTCNYCNEEKSNAIFLKNTKICKDCNNEKRRNRYNSNDEHRLQLIKKASDFKHNKVIEKQKKKLAEIGEGNKKCSNCSNIKSICNFRHNRLKCKDCERDEPLGKIKRNIRSRIYIALCKNKVMHTIEYLGLNSEKYFDWIFNYDEKFTIDNYGNEWHIDHIIPLSKFNIENKEEQLIAFNWRNTAPLSAKENLSKNNKVIISQIELHNKKLLEYHKKNNIEMPEKIIDLFAKHLVAGSSLEP